MNEHYVISLCIQESGEAWYCRCIWRYSRRSKIYRILSPLLQNSNRSRWISRAWSNVFWYNERFNVCRRRKKGKPLPWSLIFNFYFILNNIDTFYFPWIIFSFNLAPRWLWLWCGWTWSRCFVPYHQLPRARFQKLFEKPFHFIRSKKILVENWCCVSCSYRNGCRSSNNDC